MTKVTKSDRNFTVLDYTLPGTMFVPNNPDLGFVLWLYGSNSNRKKHEPTHQKFAEQLNIPVYCFDYSGHGEAPFDFAKTTPAQHFLEVITVYDELTAEHGCAGGYVIGGSYGSYLTLQLLKYRKIMAGVLRCPALLRASTFYTRWENIETEAEAWLRKSESEIRKHPLMVRAAENTAPILVVEHGEDCEIPPIIPKLLREKLSNADYWLAEGMPHSLASVSDADHEAYEDRIIDWLKKHTKRSLDQV